MKLASIAAAIPGAKIMGNGDVEILEPAYDSRHIRKGDLFCAVRGTRADGNRFIEQAVRNGAVAVLTSDPGVDASVPVILVDDDRAAMAQAARLMYGDPTAEMMLLGVTGTNGKTTCIALLQSILNAAGKRAGQIGTLGWEFAGNIASLERTTPEAPDLLKILARMRREGADAAAMEVTSIAVTMKRVYGFHFAGGLFTNLSQDHLDLHGDMETYFRAKKGLFEMLPPDAPAVVNGDDSYGARMIEGIVARGLTFGMNGGFDVNGRIIEESMNGISLEVDGIFGKCEIRSPLVGRFNAYNLLGVSTLALAVGIKHEAVSLGLEESQPVRGRMERIELENEITAVIDYCHTPDALRNALEALRPATKGRLVIVFGAGGDRDRSKRAVMGTIASQLADRVIVTSDNPRTEDPEAIIAEILEGAKGALVESVTDRREAIRRALNEAGRGDTILIAGKGHETYQEIGHERFPFDDREEVLKAWDALRETVR